MRAASLMAFVVAFGVGLVITGHCAEKIELDVRVVADNPPGEVTVNVEGDVQSILLKRDPADAAYKTALPRPGPKANGDEKLVFPYLLVASWDEAKEQLYLGLRPLTPEKLNLTIYHKSFECDAAALNTIAALGIDFDSVLRKYFRARTFHKIWRYKHGLPQHDAAIRSARLWYDAAVTLAKYRQPVFRMDEEINEIVQQYEELAERDKHFGESYRRYFPSGYFQGITEQLVALNYAFVGKIPKLVAEGRLDEAKELNARALTALSKETEEVQQIISSRQRINTGLLMNNAKYIAAKMNTNGRQGLK